MAATSGTATPPGTPPPPSEPHQLVRARAGQGMAHALTISTTAGTSAALTIPLCQGDDGATPVVRRGLHPDLWH